MVKRYEYGEEIDRKNNNHLCTCYTLSKDGSHYDANFHIVSDSKEEFLLELAKYVCENQNNKIVTDVLDLLVFKTCGIFLDSFGPGADNIDVTAEDIRGEVISYQEKLLQSIY